MASISGSHEACKFRLFMEMQEHLVDELCRDLGHQWREGKLGPGRTIGCFTWQILMGNVTCDAVSHHYNGEFSGVGYCLARQRVPERVLKELAQRTSKAALKRAGRRKEKELWLGSRVFRIDGSGVRLPDSLEVREYFGCSGRQRPGCGYPTMHLLLLTGPGGVAISAICSPLRTGDMTHASAMNVWLQAGDVLIGDGLFGGWGHLHELREQKLEGVFPAHHSRKIGWGKHAEHGANRRFVKTLGYRDQLVEYRKPRECPKWMDKKRFAAAGEWLLVREVQRQVKVGGVRRMVTVVTTLLDPKKYPARALVQLLGERWLIETQLRSLKTTMGMESLRCQSVDGVKKELLIFLIVYNLIRLLMMEAADQQKVDLDRLSFADALARLRFGTDWTIWVDLEVVPLRPGRSEPRVTKTRRKAYPVMTKPRKVLRNELKQRAKRTRAFA